jgi:hypothetical protein
MKIAPKKLVVITIVGAIITVLLEKIGVYDAIVKAI